MYPVLCLEVDQTPRKPHLMYREQPKQTIEEPKGPTFLQYEEEIESKLKVQTAPVTYPQDEINQAKEFAERLKIRHLIIRTNEFKNPNFLKNPVNRCYFCKKELFGKLKKIAKRYRLNFVADGSNLDDEKDYRPGRKAIKEFKIRSPLKEAQLTKNDIRNISREMKLPMWNKPAFACLASRFPYGMKITQDNLVKIDKAESFLRRLGLTQVRVRHHNDVARIEVLKEQLPKLLKKEIREKIISKFKELGYAYVTVDLEGYKTGSMNRVLR